MPVSLDYHGNLCPFCSRTMVAGDLKLCPSRDHLLPKSRFRNSPTIVVCSECNFMKADLTLREFLVSLDAKNKALAEFLRLNNERLENISYLLKIGIEESSKHGSSSDAD